MLINDILMYIIIIFQNVNKYWYILEKSGMNVEERGNDLKYLIVCGNTLGSK